LTATTTAARETVPSAAAIEAGDFFLRSGPFTTRVHTSIPHLPDGTAQLYEPRHISAHRDFADFHVTVAPPRGVRRWYRPQVLFHLDGIVPFKPLPLLHAVPIFEWGLNWCIVNRANSYLIIHAAAIEKNGFVAIMPGVPGAGKSTLTAGLVNRGWRLLSDEMALISLTDGRVMPLVRPISLKNESIALIRDFVPGAQFSAACHDTIKGTVAHLKPPQESLNRVDEPARPAWIIFPHYVNGLPATLATYSKAASLIEIARNAFNYSVHGARGFAVLADIVESSRCYRFSYGDLDEAVEVFAALEPPTRAGA